MDNIQLCTFRLGDFLMAFDVSEVQEVIRQQKLTPVPLASDLICGLINLRGKVVMVLDLRKRFGFEDRDPHAPATNVLHRKENAVVSFLVDEVEDVINLSQDAVEPPPATMDKASRDLVKGAVQLPDRLLLVLDGLKCADITAYTNANEPV